MGSYAFPMLSLWFPYAFPMVALWFPSHDGRKGQIPLIVAMQKGGGKLPLPPQKTFQNA